MPDRDGALMIPTYLYEDPQFMRMRCGLQVALFALAYLAATNEGETPGQLPSVSDAAWLLHADPRQLEIDLSELVELGWIDAHDGTYIHSAYLRWQAEWEAQADND